MALAPVPKGPKASVADTDNFASDLDPGSGF